MILLNPGPVSLSERVRRSLAGPDLCHREPEYFDLQDEARARLLQVYALDPNEWTAVLLTGSGTAAVESMVSSLVPADGKVLVIENGVYGGRIADICARYGIQHERLGFDWLAAADPAVIATRLDAAGARPFTHVAVVHHETTTGRLNELRVLAGVCRERAAQLLIDAVSSFGAEPLDFDNQPIAAVAATANKCLHGVPGVAFVIARRTALAQATSRTYYLDLARHSKLQDERNTPFTPAVQACYALVEALRELEEAGGRSARHAHYAALAEQLRAGLERLRVTPAIDPRESSVVLRAYALPEGLSYERLHERLKAGGFVIYAGQGRLARSLFRIATMGAVTAADIDRLLECFGKVR